MQFNLIKRIKGLLVSYYNNLSFGAIEKLINSESIPSATDEDEMLFSELMKHVICQCCYGSTVYGTKTEKSDTDYIVIVDNDIDLYSYPNGIFEYHDGNNNDYQFINESTFITMVMEYDIKALELLWLPKEYIVKGDMSVYLQYFSLNRWKLRQVISKLSSHAYAKAHKKMTVIEDYDLYKAEKSLFHSIRILIFGLQIAKYGKIVDYSEANKYMPVINGMKNSQWESYKEVFKPVLNQLRSELVVLCPKEEAE